MDITFGIDRLINELDYMHKQSFLLTLIPTGKNMQYCLKMYHHYKYFYVARTIFIQYNITGRKQAILKWTLKIRANKRVPPKVNSSFSTTKINRKRIQNTGTLHQQNIHSKYHLCKNSQTLSIRDDFTRSLLFWANQSMFIKFPTRWQH